ncbi:APC family permease [uncultured Microscilla sp.]|uniref:APC family permease n=1 Tax=uncultured Microscilla sp. TaxID=432653 RepID=UPI002601C7B7|nr:amino acid permease [uncultured Microscilla sp.]
MSKNQIRSVSFYTAIAIVVANMVGAGVFTSIGFQAAGFKFATAKGADFAPYFPILMLWLVGGIVALCGALSYGELAAMFPRSGGEYNYLSKIYHPSFGFLSGWVSATVGFSAPVALACMALGKYVASVIPGINGTVVAIGVLLVITAVHSYDVKTGSLFQRVSTVVKVVLIVGFIFGGFFITPSPEKISIIPKKGDWTMIFGSAFAINLAFVSFSYSGWNASAYLSNEIVNPKRNVPRSLLLGTLAVTVAYILLNYIFLYTVPVGELAAKQMADFNTPLEVGYLSADKIFGTAIGKTMGLMIALLLISSISAMIFAGPRVTQVMGEDLPLLKKLAVRNKKGIPVLAISLQSTISLILILTASFNTVLFYIAFALDIFTFSTVLGIFIMRSRRSKIRARISQIKALLQDNNLSNEDQRVLEAELIEKQGIVKPTYSTWGYPITPAIFLAATGWTMYYLLTQRTQGSLIALATVVLGLIIYFIDKSNRQNKDEDNRPARIFE